MNFTVRGAYLCEFIARTGSGTWHAVGGKSSFNAYSTGKLYLTTNDLPPNNCPQPPVDTSCYTDNQGLITVTITVTAG